MHQCEFVSLPAEPCCRLLAAVVPVCSCRRSPDNIELSVEAGPLPGVVLLCEDEDGVKGGVTGGVSFPPVWRGGVDTLVRDGLPVRATGDLGFARFFSRCRRTASVPNLE